LLIQVCPDPNTDLGTPRSLGSDYPLLERESREDSSLKGIPGAVVLQACCPQKSEESRNPAYSTAGWEGEIFNALSLSSLFS